MNGSALYLLAMLWVAAAALAQDAPEAEWKRALAKLEARMEQLSAQVEEQGAVIERQQAEIARLREKLATGAGPSGLGARTSRSARPAVALASAPATTPALAIAGVTGGAAAPTPAGAQQLAKSNEDAEKLRDLQKGLAGFRFSGDFRYRFDVQARSSTPVLGPLQNIRSRYRLRLNVDKDIYPRFRFHVQLSTAPPNNAITNDQDMAAMAAKHPFSIAEAYVDFHPTPRVSARGGRMEEIFADGMRFLWDDDVRFNGFHQILALPLASGFLGFKRLELRSGEYILSNPNVAVLSPASPFAQAGFVPGKKVRDANLFHPGLVLSGENGKWRHQLTADIQLYRNANQIQLASTPSGFPVLVNSGLGVALAGPLTGTGNATTAPNGAIYSAGHFQVARLAFRLQDNAVNLAGHTLPAWIDLQASRNVGTGRLRDALVASANLGEVKRLGDVRFLYQFAIKDANSMISQFTDDDLGTGTGVNIAVHALRFDVGLARYLQWQNLLFIQDARRGNNPAEHFFVPVPRGAGTTFRYLGQLAFAF